MVVVLYFGKKRKSREEKKRGKRVCFASLTATKRKEKSSNDAIDGQSDEGCPKFVLIFRLVCPSTS